MQVAAGCLFTDSNGHVLLVNPTYKPQWELPGGVVEQGESPLAACKREIREELSLDVQPSRLLVVDYREPEPGRRGDALRFVFDGGVLTAEQIASIRLAEQELSEFAFVPPDGLASYVIPALARRLHACLDDSGATYLEEGVPALG
jgi:8-oxo-dGTP diphosphatase